MSTEHISAADLNESGCLTHCNGCICATDVTKDAAEARENTLLMLFGIARGFPRDLDVQTRAFAALEDYVEFDGTGIHSIVFVALNTS